MNFAVSMARSHISMEANPALQCAFGMVEFVDLMRKGRLTCGICGDFVEQRDARCRSWLPFSHISITTIDFTSSVGTAVDNVVQREHGASTVHRPRKSNRFASGVAPCQDDLRTVYRDFKVVAVEAFRHDTRITE